MAQCGLKPQISLEIQCYGLITEFNGYRYQIDDSPSPLLPSAPSELLMSSRQ